MVSLTYGLALQALTSTEVKSRLSKQGQRFHRHLAERAALRELITDVQAGHADAKLRLYGLTKVLVLCSVYSRNWSMPAVRPTWEGRGRGERGGRGFQQSILSGGRGEW